MSNLNMLFAGFGGQGILFTGKVVAYTGLLSGKNVSWLPSYGPEMRGGTANCSVCISEKMIGSPLVTEPDVLVAMNTPSFDKFIDSVVSGGHVFIDSSIVKNTTNRRDINIWEIPATTLSNDEHLEGIANMILLGKVLKEVGFTSIETMQDAIKKCVPAKKTHLLEHNLRAVELGMA